MRNNTLLKVALVALVMSFAGTGSSIADNHKMSPKMAKFMADLKGANSATDAAKKVGGEWRDIRWKKSKAVKIKIKGKKKKMSILKAAETYAKMGNFKKANKLIKKAVFQADRGYHQALEQRKAGPTFK